jgi:hypothetical protein
MTWLGKILTIVIFLGALVWAYFTVQNYVLRTNWKVERDKYKDAYDKMRAARDEDYKRHLATEEELRRLTAYERTRTASLSKTVETLSANAKKANTAFASLQAEFEKGDINAVKAQANITALNSELDALRKRNYQLEDNAVNLTVAAEKAKAEMVRAQNSERLAQSIAAENAKKVEDLQTRVTELRATGGAGTGAATVLNTINKPAPPVLANLRGEVTGVAGDLLTIDIGIDAGLAVGTELQIDRFDGAKSRHLGTVRVTDAFNLYPKQAVVKFTPASGRPLERLRPEELPKEHDVVRPIGGNP